MTYSAIPAQPTSGQNPWYTTMASWMDGVELAVDEVHTEHHAHAGSATVHTPAGGSAGQVLTKVSAATGDYAWATPSGGGATDHGALTGLTDPDHPIAAVIGLQAALDAKSATGHTHSYEPVGTAAAGDAAHVAAGDPHPTYLTAAEGAAAYAPLAQGIPAGGTTGQVLAKSSATNYAVGWVTPSSGPGATAPLTLTSPLATDVALTTKGAASQSANVMEARLNDNNIYWGVTSTGEMRSGLNIASQNGQVRIGVNDPARQALMIRLATSQSAKAIQVTDQSLVEKFSVSKDGFVIGQNIGAPVIVLDAVQAVPSTTLAGTVVLRRPA